MKIVGDEGLLHRVSSKQRQGAELFIRSTLNTTHHIRAAVSIDQEKTKLCSTGQTWMNLGGDLEQIGHRQGAQPRSG